MEVKFNLESNVNYIDIINSFKNLIQQLKQENNLVIGGTTALMFHGLICRSPSDLDIIIYKPTERQKNIITALLDFDSVCNYVTDIRDRRAFKFNKEGYVVDILLEKESHPNMDDLLLKSIDSNYYRIQSVQEIVKAKSKYVLHDNEGLSKECLYVREKDLKDFLELKNNNFNISR